MTITQTQQTTFEVITCGTCGIVFALPDFWIANRRRESGDIYCPNGCRRTYAESEASKLRKQLEAKERELREAKCQGLRHSQQLEQERLARAKAEKKLRRVANGVCQCCKRSFQNLARHMATQHPEVKSATP